MQLYTSLVRLKQAMNGGTLPPMVPLTGAARALCDPAFLAMVGGMGGLDEDDTRGLRCAVRGCGKFYHSLETHIRFIHPEVGVDGLRNVLGIPSAASLLSHRERARRAAHINRVRSEKTPEQVARFVVARDAALARHGERGRREARGAKTRATIGAKNLRNRCAAQLSHRIIDLHHDLRREPIWTDFIDRYGAGCFDEVIRTFGTWSNALSQCGLASYQQRRSDPAARRSRALDALAAWHNVHGTLPTLTTIQRGKTTPALPAERTIRRALGGEQKKWSDVMFEVAAILGIHGGRYGLPERKTA